MLVLLFLLLLFFLFICKIYYYNVFLDVLYLSWFSKAVLTKVPKCEGKQGIEKNSNNTDINTTRNCTFVNFKNYTTLKTSKRIGLVTLTVHSSAISLKNPKLREQLFSGKKAVPHMKVILILKIGRGKVKNLKNSSGKSDQFFRSDEIFPRRKFSPTFFSPIRFFYDSLTVIWPVSLKSIRYYHVSVV